MRHPARPLVALAVALFVSAPARAQDPPPPIGPVALDLRGTFPQFPRDPLLAESRSLSTQSLPGRGIGLDAGAHVYLLTWKAITFGVGGQVTLGRARATPPTGDGQAVGAAVTERFTSLAPQLSFNFGTGDGWSYISGGIGRSIWSVVPDGADPTAADEERLQTINYGGGARWFARPHLAFTFDVRFYAINPGMSRAGVPGSPRTTLLIIGAGISVK